MALHHTVLQHPLHCHHCLLPTSNSVILCHRSTLPCRHHLLGRAPSQPPPLSLAALHCCQLPLPGAVMCSGLPNHHQPLPPSSDAIVNHCHHHWQLLPSWTTANIKKWRRFTSSYSEVYSIVNHCRHHWQLLPSWTTAKANKRRRCSSSYSEVYSVYIWGPLIQKNWGWCRT